jgi:FkbM family methyltransferase
MIRKLFKDSVRHFGYDIVEYPLPEWYLLRSGINEIFSDLQINCVIDVGANRGQYGDFLRRIGYKGRIASFEPVSSSFNELSLLTQNDDAWKAYQLAVGSIKQVLEISIMVQDQFSSFLPINSYGAAQFTKEATVTRSEQANVVRLDSMIDEIISGLAEPRIYLKMDTQGFDLQVLEGASGFLPLVLGLQSEIALRSIYEGMPDYLTSLARLNALGFSATSLVPVSRDDKLRVIEFDCLMVRSSGS